MKWIIKKEHAGMNIRDYLTGVHQFSRRILIAVKKGERGLVVNGQQVTVRYVLAEGDELEVQFPPEEKSEHMKAEQMNLDIVYEDQSVIVLNKPADLATLPSRHHPQGTVANGILYYYQQKKIDSTVHIVTRLDRGTSGLLLIAKDRYSHSILAAMQKAGKIDRKYMALVEGVVDQDKGTIDAPIDREDGSIIKRTVKAGGKEAITHFHVLERFENYTFVEVDLETGRTHQIRVHFSHIGHPLAGDDLYGGTKTGFSRHALHCAELKFTQPLTKENLHMKSDLPTDLNDWLTKLRP
jgi:23S rRNA pseudouridine1911/1915/1917 synthase